MTGGEIYDNNARNNGGGVCFFENNTFEGNPAIGGTAAPNGGGWIHGNTATQNPATNDVSQ
jgi:hypothetical protein